MNTIAVTLNGDPNLMDKLICQLTDAGLVVNRIDEYNLIVFVNRIPKEAAIAIVGDIFPG